LFGNRNASRQSAPLAADDHDFPADRFPTLRPQEGLAIVTQLVVPKTGGMNTTKATVVQWLKKEGDALKQGDPVVELETEKVNYELDSPVEGVLLKIVSREPAEVPVGGLLGYIGKPGDIVPGF
jgi:biotin carboxyl carrier protein